jgi:NADPH-dependent 2,4-dienoyl-CoA reductase/sulfur reductase-like enzyme
MRYLIVGGSIAGISCAKKIKRLERSAEVAILSEEGRPYSKMALPYALIGKRDIWLEVPDGVNFLGNKKVTEVLPEEKKVITEEAEEFRFDRLLIASGAGAAIPDFEGRHSPSVFTVRNLSDIQGIEKRMKDARTKRVIISGAGLVSVEMGDALEKIGFTPIFLISSQRVLSMILDNTGSEIVAQDLEEKGVEIHFGESIKGVEWRDGAVLAATRSGAEFTGDMVIVGKGASPNTAFLESSGIEVDRGVIANEFLETNRDGIFAAGDVCQGYDMVYGQRRVNALWPVAIEQGEHAAMNMTHFRVPYKGSVARNIVTAFGNTVFTAGLSRGDGLEVYQRREKKSYSKIVLRDNCLAGVIFINVGIDPGAYLFAIERRMDVSEYKDAMLSGSFSYSHLFPFLR